MVTPAPTGHYAGSTQLYGDHLLGEATTAKARLPVRRPADSRMSAVSRSPTLGRSQPLLCLVEPALHLLDGRLADLRESRVAGQPDVHAGVRQTGVVDHEPARVGAGRPGVLVALSAGPVIGCVPRRGSASHQSRAARAEGWSPWRPPQPPGTRRRAPNRAAARGQRDAGMGSPREIRSCKRESHRQARHTGRLGAVSRRAPGPTKTTAPGEPGVTGRCTRAVPRRSSVRLTKRPRPRSLCSPLLRPPDRTSTALVRARCRRPTSALPV